MSGILLSLFSGAPPTFAVSPSTSSVNEGSSVTFTVTTTNVANGTTLYWSLNTVSGTVNTSDFTGGAVTGSFSISSNSGSVALTLANDLTTEGSESFQLQVRTDSTSGTIVATSSTVTIADTSVPTFAVSPSTSSVNEGSSVTFTVTTAGVANGTTLYWSLNTISGTVNTSDFTGGAVTGSFSISSNSGSVALTLANDDTVETESFQLQVRTGSTSGTIVATSSTVAIGDRRVQFLVYYSSNTINTGPYGLINSIHYLGVSPGGGGGPGAASEGTSAGGGGSGGSSGRVSYQENTYGTPISPQPVNVPGGHGPTISGPGSSIGVPGPVASVFPAYSFSSGAGGSNGYHGGDGWAGGPGGGGAGGINISGTPPVSGGTGGSGGGACGEDGCRPGGGGGTGGSGYGAGGGGGGGGGEANGNNGGGSPGSSGAPGIVIVKITYTV